MAEIWTVAPDGGGDYTVLQTAEDAKDGDLTGRGVVAFWCADGAADLGECTVDGWTNQDATNYVRIFVPLTERHDGTAASAGAWIDVDGVIPGITVNEEFTRVEGISFNIDNTAPVGTGAVVVADVSNVLIGSCLCVGEAEYLGSSYISIDSAIAGMTGIVIRNNIIYGDGTADNGIAVDVDATGGNADLTIALYNNTIDDLAGVGIEMLETDGGNQATLTVTLENNICTNNGTDFAATVVRGSVTGNSNCSDDATANTWDGAGSIINQVPANLFLTVGADHALKAGSNALDAGKTIGTFDTDALHIDGQDWRPQGVAWDMGALETAASAAIYIWTNAEADQDWKAAAGTNWENEAGVAYAANRYPSWAIDGDETWFLGTTPSGATPTDGPLTEDLTGDFELATIKVANDYTGGVGTDADNPITVEMEDTSTSEVLIEATAIAAGIYLTGGNTNGLYRVLVLDGASSQDVWFSGILGDVVFKKGAQIIYDDAVSACTSLTIGYLNSTTSDAVVDIEATATLPATIRVVGGTITNENAVTTLQMTDGQWTQTSGNMTTVTISGGKMIWTDGTLATINLEGGEVDGSDSMLQRTITLCYLHTGGTLNVNNGIRNITVTQLVHLGGDVEWTPGQEVEKYS